MLKIWLSVVLLLGGLGSAASQSARPSGVVRLDGRLLKDERGAFLGLGASLFWGVWGYDHDRARLVRHLDLLRDNGFEFVRVLGVVAGESWSDRAADPRIDGYDQTIGGLTDLVFERGLRIAWTIFGDVAAAPTPERRLAIVDRFAAMARGREQKILYVEIANEAWQNGFGGNLGELSDLARRLKRRTPHLVTTTSPPPPLQCGPALMSIYAPGAADFMTFHFDRNIATTLGRWGPIQRPMQWPAHLVSCRNELPAAAASGEPIGPQSTVASEDDPLKVVTGAAVTYTAGLPIYVLHTGPGVRGGGKADRALGRAASLTDLPRVGELLRGFAALTSRLPADLPGWSAFDAIGTAGPARIQTTSPRGPKPVDIAAARRGGDFVMVPFGIRGGLSLTAVRATSVEVIHPATGSVLMRRLLDPGAAMELPAKIEALVIIGRGV